MAQEGDALVILALGVSLLCLPAGATSRLCPAHVADGVSRMASGLRVQARAIAYSDVISITVSESADRSSRQGHENQRVE